MQRFIGAFQQLVTLPDWVQYMDVTGSRHLLDLLFHGVKKFVGTTDWAVLLNLSGLGEFAGFMKSLAFVAWVF